MKPSLQPKHGKFLSFLVFQTRIRIRFSYALLLLRNMVIRITRNAITYSLVMYLILHPKFGCMNKIQASPMDLGMEMLYLRCTGILKEAIFYT